MEPDGGPTGGTAGDLRPWCCNALDFGAGRCGAPGLCGAYVAMPDFGDAACVHGYVVTDDNGSVSCSEKCCTAADFTDGACIPPMPAGTTGPC